MCRWLASWKWLFGLRIHNPTFSYNVQDKLMEFNAVFMYFFWFVIKSFRLYTNIFCLKFKIWISINILCRINGSTLKQSFLAFHQMPLLYCIVLYSDDLMIFNRWLLSFLKKIKLANENLDCKLFKNVSPMKSRYIYCTGTHLILVSFAITSRSVQKKLIHTLEIATSI